MVGLVLVAHSAELARGLGAMCAQAAPQVPVEAAAGLSHGRLGTSAPAVEGAVRRALARSGGDGALVLLDLGSAGLAVEMALEALAPDQLRLVDVTEAPLVEGAVLAAVAAGSGLDLGGVRRAAERAAAARKLPGD